MIRSLRRTIPYSDWDWIAACVAAHGKRVPFVPRCGEDCLVVIRWGRVRLYLSAGGVRLWNGARYLERGAP